MPERFGKYERQYSYELYNLIKRKAFSFLSQAQKNYFKKYIHCKRYEFQKQVLNVFSTNIVLENSCSVK